MDAGGSVYATTLLPKRSRAQDVHDSVLDRGHERRWRSDVQQSVNIPIHVPFFIAAVVPDFIPNPKANLKANLKAVSRPF